MSPKHTRVTEISTRSPRSSWNQPRSLADVLGVLERNGFEHVRLENGARLTRACGLLALRVTIVNGRAMLETALRENGPATRWRHTRDSVGTTPWQVAREALELLAVLDVDTPVRWG